MSVKKKKKTPETPYQQTLDALSMATGLTWSAPPDKPSVLENGYHTQTEMIRAPHLVRRLKDVATTATGRPRAIVFQRADGKNASVNIPKEIAEDAAFIAALVGQKKAAELNLTASAKLPAPTPGVKQIPAAMLALKSLSVAESGNSLHH